MLSKKQNKIISKKITITFISMLLCIISFICLNQYNTWATKNDQTQDITKVNEPLDLHLTLLTKIYRNDKIKLNIKNLSYAKKITVSSTNKKIAKISKDCTIHAKHCGTCVLTVKLLYKNSLKTLTIKTTVVKSSYKAKSGLCMYPDETKYINAYTTTKDASASLKISDSNIATIDGKKLIAKNLGKAQIMANSKSDTDEANLILTLSVLKEPEFKITDELIDKWFDKSIIAGHSVGVGFKSYCDAQYDGYLGSARHLCVTCYGVYNDKAPVTSSSLHMTVNGVKARLKDHVKNLKAKKVLINYGLNDIGNSTDAFVSSYEGLINELLNENKKTTVYIISPTPLYKGKGGLNNKNVRIINKALKKYAKNTKRVEFINMFKPLIDSSGKLKEEYCSDHYCHLTFAGYKVYGDTLKKFAKKRLKKDTDKDDKAFTKKETKKYKLTK